MIDIQKLAQLTGLELTADKEVKFTTQLESVITLLEKIKSYDIDASQESWHDLLGLATTPSITWVSDGTPEAIMENVEHPLVGHAIEVKAFVE